MPLPVFDIPTRPPPRDLAPPVKYAAHLIINSEVGYRLREPIIAALLGDDPMKALQALIIDRAKAADEPGADLISRLREVYHDPFRYDAERSIGAILRTAGHAPILPSGSVWARFTNEDGDHGPWYRDAPGPMRSADGVTVDVRTYEKQAHDFALFDLYVDPRKPGVFVLGMPPNAVAMPATPKDILDNPHPAARRFARASVTVLRAYLKDGLAAAWTVAEDLACGLPGLRYAITVEALWVDPSPTIREDWRCRMISAAGCLDDVEAL